MPIEASCDGAIVFEPVEEALDAVPKLVSEGAEHRRVDAVIERPDIRISALIRDLRPQRIAIVAAIGKQHTAFAEQTQHVGSTRTVVRLTFRQLDVDREAVRIDERVDFGREPAAGTAHATASTAFFSPLAAC